jgi:predicted GTPase
MKTFEEHAYNLGSVVANLQSLEFSLRLFLCATYNEPIKIPCSGQVTVPETHLTNYDSLGELIKKYNNIAASVYSHLMLDTSVVEIRDALAHGRTLAPTPDPPVRIFKFDRPKKGIVNVSYDQVMDQQWFNQSRKLIVEQIGKVQTCAKQLGYKIFG